MRHHITTEIEIDVPIETVWAILTDLDRYPEWNPFMVSSTGRIAVGEKLRNRMEPPGGKAMTFSPTITEVAEGTTLEWLGHLGIPGLFDGRHRFELRSLPNGSTLVNHSEQFSGFLVRPLRRSLDEHSRAGFIAMNEAWRARAVDFARTG